MKHSHTIDKRRHGQHVHPGEFQHNCIEGKGKKTLPDGSWFEAGAQMESIDGINPDLTSWQGQFHDSELEGRGTFHWPDGVASKLDNPETNRESLD